MTTHRYDPRGPGYGDPDTWGLRAENVEMAHRIPKPLMDTVRDAETDLVAGDSHLSNTAIREATSKVPLHPLQVLAQAYGIVED